MQTKDDLIYAIHELELDNNLLSECLFEKDKLIAELRAEIDTLRASIYKFKEEFAIKD